MSRLPTPGGDSGNWGTILNDYLSAAHKADGTLKTNSVTSDAIAPGSITATELQNSSVNLTKLSATGTPDGTTFLRGDGTWATLAGGSGDVVGQASSIDSEVALFSGTGGKTIKRATVSGLAKLTSGVLSAAVEGSDFWKPGGTDVAVADGGTGASTAASARVNLGVNVVTPLRFATKYASIGASTTDKAYIARTLTGATMRVGDAPSGSALTVQVQHSPDGSSWSTIATLTIADGSTTETQASFSQAQSAGQYLRVNVTAAGSTMPAQNVVVDVAWN